MHFDQNLFGKPSGEKLCCFKNELIGVNYLSTEELFGGYDTINLSINCLKISQMQR